MRLFEAIIDANHRAVAMQKHPAHSGYENRIRHSGTARNTSSVGVNLSPTENWVLACPPTGDKLSPVEKTRK
jgi:hypothetical protein